MPEPIIPKTIIEGSFPDCPQRRHYSGVPEEIPKNAVTLSTPRVKYLLYARTPDFNKIEILNNPYFDRLNSTRPHPDNLIKQGWPLEKQINNFNWIFDNQRSLTTSDGRIYIQTDYFCEGFRFYLDLVPQIIKDCRKVFSEGLSVEGINSNKYF